MFTVVDLDFPEPTTTWAGAPDDKAVDFPRRLSAWIHHGEVNVLTSDLRLGDQLIHKMIKIDGEVD